MLVRFLRTLRRSLLSGALPALNYAGAIPLDESLRQSAQLCRPVLMQAPDLLRCRIPRYCCRFALLAAWRKRSGRGRTIHAATVTLEPTHNSQRTPSLMYTAAGQPDRDQLVQRFVPLVKRIAYHLMARLPSSVQVDDLVQNGMIGLLDAMDRFERVLAPSSRPMQRSGCAAPCSMACARTIGCRVTFAPKLGASRVPSTSLSIARPRTL
jgi:hypothetical protein